MTKTLCDTNILIDIYGVGQEWHCWSASRIAEARRRGPVAIDPLIPAEFSIGFETPEEVFELLDPGLFGHEALPYAAAHLAGRAFLAYRRRGGDRRSPLPDFCIGAHALVAGHRLLTRDAARYRDSFPELDIVCPETHP